MENITQNINTLKERQDSTAIPKLCLPVKQSCVHLRPIDHFGTEHFGKSHFGTDVSSREPFGAADVPAKAM